MNKKSLVGTHLRGSLNAGFLIDPVEKRLDRLPNPAYGFGKQLICRWEGILALVLLGPESTDRGFGLLQVAL
jgi:hypothetical protein